MEKKEISFIDYISVLVRWRKFVIINSLIVCILAAVISFIVPKWYKAYSVILPPAEEASDLGLSSILNNLPIGGLNIGLGGFTEGSSLFLAIVDSRTVIESVVNEFGLITRYKKKNMEEAVKTLRKRVSMKINDEGTMTLSVEAKTSYFPTSRKEDEARELSKNMANYIIQQLDIVNKQLKVDRAKNTRIFLERRVNQNMMDLHDAEEAFKRFQEKHGTIALPEQTAATITAAAELRAQIVAKEIELGVFQKYIGGAHTDIIRTKNELNELRNKYEEFIYGKVNDARVDRGRTEIKDIFLPMEDVPDLSLQFARLYREVMMQEKIYEFLLPQYEQAKIQEARDTPTVQVLDPAVRPEKRSKPRRMLIVLFAGIVSVLIAAMTVYFAVNLEYIKTSDIDRFGKIQTIFEQLKVKNWFK